MVTYLLHAHKFGHVFLLVVELDRIEGNVDASMLVTGHDEGVLGVRRGVANPQGDVSFRHRPTRRRCEDDMIGGKFVRRQIHELAGVEAVPAVSAIAAAPSRIHLPSTNLGVDWSGSDGVRKGHVLVAQGSRSALSQSYTE